MDELSVEQLLGEMQEEADGLRDKFWTRQSSELGGPGDLLLEEIAIRLEMIYLVLRGGIDGKKEE